MPASARLASDADDSPSLQTHVGDTNTRRSVQISPLVFWFVAILCSLAAYAAARGMRQGLLLSIVFLLLFGGFARAWYRGIAAVDGVPAAGSTILLQLTVAHVLVALAGVVGYAARKRFERP